MSGRRRSKEEPQADGLPQPPEVPRRLRFRWTQLAGMVIVLAAPALSLAGLLEASEQTTTALSVDQGIEIRVRYPTRMRYRTNRWLVVDVRNRGPSAQKEIAVQIDPAYVQGFNPIAVAPEPRQAFDMALGEVPAGQWRQAAVLLQAERYGRRPGWVKAQPARGAGVQVPIRTLVLW